MADKRPLALLVELAQERRDAAGQRLGRSLLLLKDSESRLALLERYRDEYQDRYTRTGTSGVGPQELRNFREFLERLDKAVAQQRAEVEALARGASESRGRWLTERTRGKSLDVLSGRAADAERASEARQQQKLLDEFSGRQTPATQ